MSSEHPEPRRHSVWWVLLITVGLALFAVQVYRFVVHRQVRSQIAAIKRAGFPTDLFELQGWHPNLPDKENAALPILEAANSLEIPPKDFNPDKWPVRSEELGQVEREALKRVLTNNSFALETIHQAAQLKSSRFAVNYERGPNALVPHLAKVKSLTHLLKAAVLIDSEEGQVSKAVDDVLDSVALSRSLDTEPILISQLVRIACLTISCSSLERLLNQHSVPEPLLVRLEEAIRAAREASTASIQGGLVGETCFGVYFFQARPSEIVNDLGSESNQGLAYGRILYPLYGWTGIKDRDYRFYLQGMRQMVDTAKLPFPERLGAAKTVGEHIEAASAHSPLLVISRMLMPALQKSQDKAAELEAHLRLAEAALAIERFRAQNKQALPADVSQLRSGSAPLPADPYDGAPLRFKKLSPGYVLYSIGPDRNDDDGAERSHKDSKGRRVQSGTGYDITFAVQR